MEDKKDVIKLYGIEKKSTYYGNEFRWYSFYNSARGAWYQSKESAIFGGEKHQKIVMMIHCKNINDEAIK